MSTASGDIVRKRGTRANRPIRPITWAILALVFVVSLGAMILVIFQVWPVNGGVEQPRVGSVTPTSQNAPHVKVESVGDPVRQDDQVTLKVKITNDGLMQSPAPQGTPTPGVGTPTPEPARIINATVKVLYYDQPATDPARKIVGSGIGNYFDQKGLADKESATIDVVATGVGNFKSYQIFPDTVFTDKDPVKVPTP